MKQRFNALDIRATVVNLRERLTGLRLQNIYDVNSKTFLFKFAKPDDKELVLIESGTRIHTTQFSREKSAMPSMFCAKLRKYLRTRRLTNVRQVGIDRIVDFEFAGGEKSNGYHIISEFYASGNILLTDHEYRILAVLRVVQNSETVNTTVGEIYNMNATLHDFQKVDIEKLKQVLQKAGPKDTLKKILNIGFEYGPAMTEHIILEAGLDPNTKVATDFDYSDDSPALKDLLEAFIKGDEMVASTGNKVPNGYIILLDQPKGKKENEESKEIDIYDEFHPYLYNQHKSKKYLEYPTFDGAVDEFYSAIESQKLEMKARNQENAALKKLEAVRREQEGRVNNLLSQQMTNTQKAQLIEYNLDMVDAAISIIRNAVASQMDWLDLKELVLDEKRKSNPIALMIDDLKLKSNQITLLLSEPRDSDYISDSDDSDESDDESDESNDDDKEEKKEKKEPQVFKVDVDISLTAFANARNYYDMKRSTAAKHEKTIAATSKAMKSAEKKIRQDLKETKISISINKIRKPYWFEKFLWFISTEGYLVIAGRDMQQNEMLVKRYLLKGDVYVHADLHGAASVVIKNKPECVDQPIPPSTLFQAGTMSVCQSKAWDAKIVTSAYWVHPDQVSKSAPTGEYLTTGSFMIRGKKNFLPPVQLVYGFGYLFKLDESSIGNHVGEKKARSLENDDINEASTNTNENDSNVPSEKDNDKNIIDVTTTTENDNDKEKEGDNDSIKKEDANSDNENTTMKEGSFNNDTDSGSSDDSDSDDEAFPDTQLEPSTNDNDLTNNNTGQNQNEKSEWNKYDLQDYGHNEDADKLPSFAQNESLNEQQEQQKTKKTISAKERRDMKKGIKGGSTTPTTNDTASASSKNNQSSKNKTKETKQQTPTRGRKGKAKKIKEKYADQDEEERQLRMELLGSNKGPQPKGKKAKKLAKENAEKLAFEKEREARRQQMKEQEEKEKNQGQETSTGGETKKDTKNNTQENDKDDDIRELLKEENITMLDQEEIDSLTPLDSLTANPLPDDILHFAVPICAPYQALQKYKYKIKLTPGSLKRGKAIKQAQMVFFKNSEITTREKELIKGVPDMEAINVMMSKVKVSAPNLEASKKKKGGKK
ncbi:fibronectin-binding protein A N-terminus-domain-containing protein [Cunninghamella echinulata]|nr:fibronectin-binding protein A N-terminus-domain-containing protein [Cunninghamella echinulata]